MCEKLLSEKRRKSAFTFYEKEFLKEILCDVAHIIESKKTDADCNRKKAEAWKGIAEIFNRNPKCNPALPRQLKKLWNNMKTIKARDAKLKEIQRCQGDGPHEPDVHTEDIVQSFLPSISMRQGSDGNGDDIQDTDSMSWMSLNKMPHYVEPEPTIKTECVETTETPTTSSYKKRLPRVSTISRLRKNIIKKDLQQQQMKFEIEIEYLKKRNEIQMEHLRKKNDMEYKMLLLEYEHKNKLYQLIENEQKLKLQELYYN